MQEAEGVSRTPVNTEKKPPKKIKKTEKHTHTHPRQNVLRTHEYCWHCKVVCVDVNLHKYMYTIYLCTRTRKQTHTHGINHLKVVHSSVYYEFSKREFILIPMTNLYAHKHIYMDESVERNSIISILPNKSLCLLCYCACSMWTCLHFKQNRNQ